MHMFFFDRKKGKSDVQMLPSTYNSMTLYISHLREADAGEYKCEAREITKGSSGDILQSSVHVNVLSKFFLTSSLQNSSFI